MKIIRARREDLTALVGLALRLWPGHGASEQTDEFEAMLDSEDAVLFLAVDGAVPAGFAQCQLRRDYVEGTETSPVGYLEGIYVAEPYRKRGLAKALLAQSEDWARRKGCLEFASDCELGNDQSLIFHLSVGFQEANRVICFTKKL